MTDLVNTFRVMLPVGRHQRTSKLVWTTESFITSKLYHRQAIWSYQELYFLVDNRHFILKSDYMNLTYLDVTVTGSCDGNFMFLDFYLYHVPGKEVH